MTTVHKAIREAVPKLDAAMGLETGREIRRNQRRGVRWRQKRLGIAISSFRVFSVFRGDPDCLVPVCEGRFCESFADAYNLRR